MFQEGSESSKRAFIHCSGGVTPHLPTSYHCTLFSQAHSRRFRPVTYTVTIVGRSTGYIAEVRSTMTHHSNVTRMTVYEGLSDRTRYSSSRYMRYPEELPDRLLIAVLRATSNPRLLIGFCLGVLSEGDSEKCFKSKIKTWSGEHDLHTRQC